MTDINEEYENCYCENGRLMTECCSGNNCSCRGETLDMGICRVCVGTGMKLKSSSNEANINYLRGFGGYVGYSLNGERRIGE